MGVELGMRVLELERPDAHGSILALAPPEALQGTAGIHGCDTRGCATAALESPLFCGMEERGDGMEKKWKRRQRRGGKGVKKRWKRVWRSEKRGWRRDGKGGDSSLKMTWGILMLGYHSAPSLLPVGGWDSPRHILTGTRSPLWRLLLFPRVNLKGSTFFLPTQALKETQNDLIDICGDSEMTTLTDKLLVSLCLSF